MKIGDYVRISPDSEFSYQIREAGNAGKIIRDKDSMGFYGVEFKDYANGYKKEDLIKITKQKWFIGMIK